jgi:hypothetical protein
MKTDQQGSEKINRAFRLMVKKKILCEDGALQQIRCSEPVAAGMRFNSRQNEGTKITARTYRSRPVKTDQGRHDQQNTVGGEN